VLAGVAFIASIALAVTPFRQAIVQVSSTVLTGGQGSGGGSTEGSGSPAGSGTGTSPGGASGAAGTAAATPGTAGSPAPTPTPSCQQQAPAGPTVPGTTQDSGSTARIAAVASVKRFCCDGSVNAGGRLSRNCWASVRFLSIVS